MGEEPRLQCVPPELIQSFPFWSCSAHIFILHAVARWDRDERRAERGKAADGGDYGNQGRTFLQRDRETNLY